MDPVTQGAVGAAFAQTTAKKNNKIVYKALYITRFQYILLVLLPINYI